MRAGGTGEKQRREGSKGDREGVIGGRQWEQEGRERDMAVQGWDMGGWEGTWGLGAEGKWGRKVGGGLGLWGGCRKT